MKSWVQEECQNEQRLFTIMPTILNTRHEQSVFWMIIEGQEDGAIVHHDVCHGVLIML
jgi:hypothetical protein